MGIEGRKPNNKAAENIITALLMIFGALLVALANFIYYGIKEIIIFIFNRIKNSSRQDSFINNKELIYYHALELTLENIDVMSGYEFEELIIDYLRNNDYEDVEGTKYSGDFGVDIIAYKDGLKYAIQCKRFNSKVNLKAVQEVVAGKKHYQCNNAIVVTNNYFSKSAIQLAESNFVELIDRDDLTKFLKSKIQTIDPNKVMNEK